MPRGRQIALDGKGATFRWKDCHAGAAAQREQADRCLGADRIYELRERVGGGETVGKAKRKTAPRGSFE